MPDPLTIGALVAAAISAGATEAGKAALGAAAKDAYEKLKSAAGRLLGGSAADLEAKPDSASRAGVVTANVSEQSPADQAELKALAEALRTALLAEGRGTTHFSAGRDQYIVKDGGIANIDQRGRHG